MSLPEFWKWVAARPEKRVAVVCHHNTILTMLKGAVGIAPQKVRNCDPISLCLAASGRGLVLGNGQEAFWTPTDAADAVRWDAGAGGAGGAGGDDVKAKKGKKHR